MLKLVQKSFRTTFAVKQEHLRILVRELPDFQSMEIRAKCADKERTFSSLDQLFDFKNMARESIRSLEISTWNSAEHFSLIRLENEYSTNVQMFFNGEPETGKQLLQTVDDFVEISSPWYKVITNNRVLALLISAFFLLYAVLVGGSLIFKTELVTSVFAKSWWPLIIGPFIGFGLIMVFTYLFPAGSFAIGDGERRYQTREVFRIGVVLSTAASIVSTLVLKAAGA